MLIEGEVWLKGTGRMNASFQIEGGAVNESNREKDRGGGKTEVLLSGCHLMKIKTSR